MSSMDLPSGWTVTKVSQISELIRGVSYPKEESTNEFKDGFVPILRATNIQGDLDYNNLVYVPQKRVDDKQFVRELDILIAMSSGSKDLVGKTAQAKKDTNTAFGTFCGLLRVESLLNKKYIGFYFQSGNYRLNISKASSGVNINNLRRNDIENLDIPLPPLPEQQRIVTKIEELFTKLDAGIETMKKIRLQLKSYRQSVLKYAFEGKLTSEWREAHKGELEPASELLERIKAERKKAGKYKELPPLDTTELPELPEGWVWTRVYDLAYVVTKGSTPTTYGYSYTVNGVNFIKVENLKDGFIDKESIKQFISEGAYNNFKRSQLLAKDLLFTIAGTLGKIAIVRKEDLPANTNQAISLIRCPWQLLNNAYLYYCLQSPTVRLFLLGRPRGVGMNNIGLNDVKEIPISLSTSGEQQKIVEEIERHFSIADKIEATIEQSLKQAERLRQSILKRAFEGKLVPQDPSDEPAEKLLERIKAEKAQNQTQPKRRRTSNGK